MMQHLTKTSLQALLAGSDPAPELLAHLESGCEHCDAFLAQSAALDGEVDAVLLVPEVLEQSPLDELGWRRLRSRMRRGPSVWVLVATLAAAASLAIVVTRPEAPVPTGEKGSGALASLGLTAAAQRPDGSLVPVLQGGVVTSDETLVFEATVDAPTDATLWVQRGHASPEALGVVTLSAGTHALRAADALLGFSLSGERGPLVLWLVSGDGGLSPEGALGQGATAGHAPVSRLDVTVTP
jgi:hypothetical protein